MSDPNPTSREGKEYPCDNFCSIKSDIQQMLDLMGPGTPKFPASSDTDPEASHSKLLELFYDNDCCYTDTSAATSHSQKYDANQEKSDKVVKIENSLEKIKISGCIPKKHSNKSSITTESETQETTHENKKHSNTSLNKGVTTHPPEENPTKDCQSLAQQSNLNDECLNITIPIKYEQNNTSTVNEETFRSNQPSPYCPYHDNCSTYSCNTDLHPTNPDNLIGHLNNVTPNYTRVCSRCMQPNTASVEVNVSESKREEMLYEVDYGNFPSRYTCADHRYMNCEYCTNSRRSPKYSPECDKKKCSILEWVKPKNMPNKNSDLYKMKEVKMNGSKQLQRLVFERIVSKDCQEQHFSGHIYSARHAEGGIFENASNNLNKQLQNTVETRQVNSKIPQFQCVQKTCNYINKTFFDKTKPVQCNERNNTSFIGDTLTNNKTDNVKEVSNNTPAMKTYQDTSGMTRIDVYYFDHGNTDYYCTTDSAPTIYTEMLAEKTEMYTVKFWANMFGTIHIGFAFFTSFLTQLFRFFLYAFVRPLLIGFMQLSSDYCLKPFLSTSFNSFIQPILIFFYNVASSLRDICDPIAACFGYFLREFARIVKAFRLVEVNSNNNIKRGTCEAAPTSNQSKINTA